jgi:hypothetical protein
MKKRLVAVGLSVVLFSLAAALPALADGKGGCDAVRCNNLTYCIEEVSAACTICDHIPDGSVCK